MVTSLRSKWAVGKARGGRISEWICNRGATPPPAHFQRNPPGRGRLAVFPRCSLLTYQSRYARRARLEKQPTDLRRRHHYMRDGTLDPRVRRTRQLLVQAFFELLSAKDFGTISVQDIAEKATVNRATFYDHFPDKFALLDYTIEDSFQQALRSRMGDATPAERVGLR